MISIVICLLPLWASPDEKTVFTELRRRTVYFYMILPLPLFLMGAFLPSWLGTDGQFDGLLYPLAMPMATFFWVPLGDLLMSAKTAWLALNQPARMLFLGLQIATGLFNVVALSPLIFGTVKNAAAFQPRAERMAYAKPLTPDEAHLLQSTRFDLSVGVENTVLGHNLTLSLIKDLRARQLFKLVAPLAGMKQPPDLIAAMGDGAQFSLRRTTRPDTKVRIKVRYKKGGIFQWREDREQYLDRLTVETIKAVRILQLAKYQEFQ